ncbi:CinA family protein [Methylocystis iwaonis]|uniref:Competence damage-inducible protein A n=1 Tax=Methylocystis iwaonis TaxID=2885079 RepID=A0ABM8E8Z3_9HYPH|nr:CinA family protein [Methylocystis iwaonis]BDV34453.1 competence damage-inducible protein A [Methylocystis iwaonis]
MQDTFNVKAITLIVKAKERGFRVATAESCTGGLVSAALTDIPGASDVFDRGFVTYSNAAKIDMLGVCAAVIDAYGAVSAETAQAMAKGALEHSLADVAVAITGVAGPGGGTPQKPVGLVHFACAKRGAEVVAIERRFGPLPRREIRQAAVDQALDLMISALGD